MEEPKERFDILRVRDFDWQQLEIESVGIKYFNNDDGLGGGQVTVTFKEPLDDVFRLDAVAVRIHQPRSMNGLAIQRVYIPVVANGFGREWQFRFVRELRCVESETVLR